MIHGKDIRIFEGSPAVEIANSKSCYIFKRADTKESSSPTSGDARTYVPGRTDWSVSLDTLVTDVRGDVLRVGQIYTLTIVVSGSAVFSGTVICTECQITAACGNLARGSFNFKGSGELAQVQEEES